MAKVLRCKDLGFDCEHVIEAETEEEVLEAAVRHAREAHQVAHVPDEMLEQLRQAIQERWRSARTPTVTGSIRACLRWILRT